ncbi:MAG: sulfatase-like hydrolase/transferase [Bdellovibrionota bacterium]
MWFLAYFLLHLAFYTLIRVEFLIWNWDSFKSMPVTEILWAFLNGLRFDLSVLGLTVGLCFLGLIWLSRHIKLQKIWFLFFIFINFVFFVINTFDVELFNFTAKRFSSSGLYLVGEGSFAQYIEPYLLPVILSFFVLGCYAYLAYQLSRRFQFNSGFKNKILISFLILLVSVVFSRGGFQLKPLTFVDAKLFNNSYANNLVLNSTFTILKSLGKSSLQRINHFETKEMLSLLNSQDIEALSVTNNQKSNIVIVILESFSKEYLALQNPEATPFLNQLRQKGFDFKNAYANGGRSIEGIAAIFSGIPALMEEPFINSEFSANQIIGLGSLLAAQNFHTSFFHAAANGSMHFDRFTKSVGIENYFGLNEYPDSKDHDGSWGIYDEPYLQWACKKISEFPSPFFSSIFTLSSHQPYSLPEQYTDKFKDERAPVLKSIQYTDFSLEQFMKCAEKAPWYNNTVFIFTADHTGPFLDAKASFESRYQIPLVLFSPQKESLGNIDTNQYAQHIDLLPTILDILNIDYKNKNYLSRSLLRSGPKVIALYADRHYQLIGDIKDEDKQLKAIQQYFSEGLYDNRLYYPSK